MDLDLTLRTAVELGASDIHLKVGQPPIVRRDGALGAIQGIPPLADHDLEAALQQITAIAPTKLQAFLETGELDIAYTGDELPRFRVNVFRQRGAISFAFRVIPRQVPSFADLRLPPGVKRLAEEHRGLILVTGATGSGKTTTLAAVIDHINRSRRQHIVTIEDPIEILHDDRGCIVNQREIGLDTNDFGQALRRALRQDPDVILVGELRDGETAQTALSAAESGHLVLSTMHTIDAAETIGRMVEFFPPLKQQQIRTILAGVLRGVISQRLIPRAKGGRVAAVEVMVSNSRIGDLIRENRVEEIHEAIAEGAFFQMQTFTSALIDLVLSGEITREIAAESSTNKHDFLVALDYALEAPGRRASRDARRGAVRPRAGAAGRGRGAARAPRRAAAVTRASPSSRRSSRRSSARGLGAAPTSSPSSRTRPRRRRSRSPRALVPNAPGAGARPRGGAGGRAAALVPQLVQLWQRAGSAYGIPWQVLAAINKVESNFGRNMGPSSAGAVGWMQFMPSTWARWGVDANGDGHRRPLERGGRDLLGRALPRRVRRPDRHLARGLLVQPCAVVRRRGAPRRAALRRRRRAGHVPTRPDAGGPDAARSGRSRTRTAS